MLLGILKRQAIPFVAKDEYYKYIRIYFDEEDDDDGGWMHSIQWKCS